MDIVLLREALYRALIAPSPLTGASPYRNLTPTEAAPIHKLADIVAGIFGVAETTAYKSGYNDRDDEDDDGSGNSCADTAVTPRAGIVADRLNALAEVFAL